MLQEVAAPVAVQEPQPVSLPTPVQDRSLEWLRYPTWGGSAYVALHPLDAEFVGARGWLKVNGIRAEVRAVNDKPFINGKVGVDLDFMGRWKEPHP